MPTCSGMLWISCETSLATFPIILIHIAPTLGLYQSPPQLVVAYISQHLQLGGTVGGIETM